MRDNVLVFSVGFLAQILFSGRMIIQWFRSEKAGKPLSPTIFWQLSLFASMMLFVYGVLRKDFAIVLGQLLVYFIYIRNLQLKNRWKTIPLVLRWIFYVLPAFSLGYLFSGAPNNIHEILGNENVSFGLLLWGSAGQLIFTFRFVYQWIDSERQNESVLSTTFWIISLAGSLMIISYAVFRQDPVLFLGQLTGAFVYSRNLLLGLNHPGFLSPIIRRMAARLKKRS